MRVESEGRRANDNPAGILVIEDDEDIRTLLQIDLAQAGYRVETAVDGLEGLSKFASGEKWDVVILDQSLPHLEGLEVLRQIHGRNPAVCVIMVTAHTTLELAIEAEAIGVIDFLRKPFSFDVLHEVIQTVLSKPPGQSEENSGTLFYRGVNGYRFRHQPLPPQEEETERLRVRRAFEVEAPTGEAVGCSVEVTLYARQVAHLATGQDYPPDHAVWDFICESALANHLCHQAEIPADILPVYDLTPQHLEAIRHWAALANSDGATKPSP